MSEEEPEPRVVYVSRPSRRDRAAESARRWVRAWEAGSVAATLPEWLAARLPAWVDAPRGRWVLALLAVLVLAVQVAVLGAVLG